MNKKRFLIILFVIVIGFIPLHIWAQQPRTLAEIMKGSVSVEKFYTRCKTMENGEFDVRSLKVRNPEGIADIWSILEETEVTSMRWEPYTSKGFQDGDVWYEVEEIQNLHWVQIMNSGKVHAHTPLISYIYPLDTIYTISDAEWQECTVALEEVMQKYGEE